VLECENIPHIPQIPNTDQATDSIVKLCTAMDTMPGCSTACVTGTGSQCDCAALDSANCFIDTKKTSMIQTLSTMCSYMQMDGCEVLNSMCNSVPSNSLGSLCGSSPQTETSFCKGSGTSMFMSGMKGRLEASDPCLVFLFSGWVIDSHSKHAGALIGAFLMGLFNSLCVLVCRRLPPISSARAIDQTLAYGFFRLVVVFIQLVNAYFLMLLAMSYYAWLVIMVAFGLAVGQIAVSPNNDVVEPCHSTMTNASDLGTRLLR